MDIGVEGDLPTPARQVWQALLDAGASVATPLGVDGLAQLVAVPLPGGAVLHGCAALAAGPAVFFFGHGFSSRVVNKKNTGGQW